MQVIAGVKTVSKKMKLKIVILTLSLLLVVSVAANAVLFLVSRFSEDVVESQMVIVQIVESLLKSPPPNLSNSEVQKRVKAIYPNADVKSTEDSIVIGNAKLYFKNGVYWGSSYKLE
jgi:hypothetical protein